MTIILSITQTGSGIMFPVKNVETALEIAKAVCERASNSIVVECRSDTNIHYFTMRGQIV